MVVVIFIHTPISSATVSVIAHLHTQRATSTIALTCVRRGQPYSRTNARLAAMESFCMKRKKRTAFRFTPLLSLFLKKALYLHATCHPPNYINASSKVEDYLPIDHGSAKSLATRRGTSAGSERSICRQ